MPNITVVDGKIHSAKIEYNAVDNCNPRCSECSHLSPYQKPGALSIDSFKRDLKWLASVYRVQRFRFVGGESLLNRDLTSLVGIVRESGITKDVEVTTNGVLLDWVSDDVLSAFDRISVSPYPTKQAATIDAKQLGSVETPWGQAENRTDQAFSNDGNTCAAGSGEHCKSFQTLPCSKYVGRSDLL